MQAEIRTIPWLMVEALIAEAVFPIAATGNFGRMEGLAFLQMVQRKVHWMQQNADHLVEAPPGVLTGASRAYSVVRPGNPGRPTSQRRKENAVEPFSFPDLLTASRSVLFAIGFFAANAPAAAPTMRPIPSTSPAAPDATGPEKSANHESDPAVRKCAIARLFSELASADARVREAARGSMMEGRRTDLPDIRDLVREHYPLFPSQAVVLKEIVTQMYLADAMYDTNGRDGFLGSADGGECWRAPAR